MLTFLLQIEVKQLELILKQEISSDSKILIYFCKKHEFLVNVCQLVKKCSLLRTLLSPFEV